MPVANTESEYVGQAPTVADRIVDTARHAVHLSHAARFVKSIVDDGMDDGVHAAKRAVKRLQRGVETLKDVKAEAAHYGRHGR